MLHDRGMDMAVSTIVFWLVGVAACVWVVGIDDDGLVAGCVEGGVLLLS